MDLEIFANKFPVDTNRDKLQSILTWADHLASNGEWPGIFGGFPYYLTPGELFDRYTIMAIKAKRLGDRSKADLMAHRATQLARGLFPNTNLEETPYRSWLTAVKSAANQLHQINDALWRVEDHLRDAELTVFPADVKPPGSAQWDLQSDPPVEDDAPLLSVSDVDDTNLPNILLFAHLSRMVCRLNRLRMLVKKRIDELFAQIPEPKDYRGELEE